ncbi:E3 ubiquitin-protein ligase MGRN1 isoform X2 [Strongylocentrotus purpuratus]|uniref:RING-type E3 ubiquitin transferase n=1 Tax=Strongylocentrotus purpuratus TaxID=7668 RepID=A0A7M7NQR0_STRPU|nr:E3 ubiquitin-protein ligase MGRN1 isoform X2 [Strongylocentrotus purpuratus]
MGSLQSMQNSNVQQVEIAANSAYRFPPKSGCYFGSHFSMGGQRFETPQPEAYLFGENADVNYLNSRPAPFPYPAPQPNEPTKTLKSLVNIRKDSLKLVKAISTTDEESESPSTRYSIEFIFDSEAKTAITFYFFATEEITGGKAVYTAKNASLRSETFRYERGANQTFAQPAFTFDPSDFDDGEFTYDPLKDVIPIVIQCTVDEGDEHSGHCHTLIATFEQSADGAYTMKPMKQKQMVEGVFYLLQEIYGIENKNNPDAPKQPDEEEFPDDDDNGSDCVICMSDARDTLILPCRHLCLCNGCADSLRFQASCCPICRAPFRALLQIRALRKVMGNPAPVDDEESSMSQENVPPGYEAIPLGEALNGPGKSVQGAEGGATGGGETLSRSGTSEGRRKKKKSRTNSLASLRSRGAATPAAAVDQANSYQEVNEKNEMMRVDVRGDGKKKTTDEKQEEEIPVINSGNMLTPQKTAAPVSIENLGAAALALNGGTAKTMVVTLPPEPEMNLDDRSPVEVLTLESEPKPGSYHLDHEEVAMDNMEPSANNSMFLDGNSKSPDAVSHGPSLLGVDIDLPGTPTSDSFTAPGTPLDVSSSLSSSSQRQMPSMPSTPSNIQLEEAASKDPIV